MTKEMKEWIKSMGLLIKNVKFVDDEVKEPWHYNKLYRRSKGSYSGNGFVFFITSSGMLQETSGNIHIMSEEVSDKVFHVDNMPIGINK